MSFNKPRNPLLGPAPNETIEDFQVRDLESKMRHPYGRGARCGCRFVFSGAIRPDGTRSLRFRLVERCASHQNVEVVYLGDEDGG